MAVFFTLFSKLIPLYFLILLGFIAGRLYKKLNGPVALLVIYIIAPVVIFNGVVTTKISLSTISIPILFFVVCSFISILIYYISGFIWKDSAKNILGFVAGTANTGYIGLPVAVAIFGNEVIGIVALALLGTTLYTNSFGFFLAAKGQYNVKSSLVRVIKLPILYAFLLGIIINVFGIHLGKIYFDIAGIFSRVYIILGMMLIGLGLTNIKKFAFDKKFVGISFFAAFILWPIVILTILFLDSHTLKIYDANLYKILMLMSILPVATNVIPYSTLLKSHPEKVSLVVFLTTLFSLFYIPLIITIFF